MDPALARQNRLDQLAKDAANTLYSAGILAVYWESLNFQQQEAFRQLIRDLNDEIRPDEDDFNEARQALSNAADTVMEILKRGEL